MEWPETCCTCAFICLTIVAWLYLWLTCVFSAKVPFKRKLGTHALLILALGVPSLGTVMVGGAFLLFGLEYILWSLMVVGCAMPMLGIKIVSHDREKGEQADPRH